MNTTKQMRRELALLIKDDVLKIVNENYDEYLIFLREQAIKGYPPAKKELADLQSKGAII